jgi:hypothetical protein
VTLELVKMASLLLSKTVRIKMYRIKTLPVVSYGCETWFLTLSEEHKVRVLENRMLKTIRDQDAHGNRVVEETAQRSVS